MKASSLDFGMMLNPTAMMNMCTVLPSPENDIRFRLSLLHREITVEFLLEIRGQRTVRSNTRALHVGKEKRLEKFRFRIPFSQLKVIHHMETGEDKFVLHISLDTPPRFFKKLDPAQAHDDEARFWSEHDAWYRQTDVVYTQSLLKKSPLNLKKTRPIVNLGK